MENRCKPELLAPAGKWESLIAAVQAGADAVYLGGKSLNARLGAGNFDDEELKRASDYLHERGKRLYVTVNTMVKQSELGVLEEAAASLAACRADAAIIQDPGVSEYLKAAVPGLKLHASTQMAVNNAQGAELLKQKGFDRVVLAREMGLEEIRACADTGIEVEVFCHGALCVACSGQCLFSSMVGGRSGNRGACAQPCRLKYRLSGAQTAEGCLLSTKDLMTAPILDKITAAGACSLKIEGRLKRPEYVAIVTGIYRRLLDGDKFTEKDEEELAQIFNRGSFTRGYAEGIRDGEFLSVARPNHRGVQVGQAVNTKQICLSKDVSADDTLVIRPDNGEDVPVKLDGVKGRTIVNPVQTAGEVYRLVSSEQMRSAQEVINGDRQDVEVRAQIELNPGSPAKITVSDGVYSVSAEGETVQKAAKTPTDPERVRAQIEKTGGTPYKMKNAAVIADKDAFIPVSVINAIRRDSLEKLSELRMNGMPFATGEQLKYDIPRAFVPVITDTKLTAQSSDMRLLKAALSAGADDVIYAPDDLRPDAMENADMTGMYLYLPPVAHTDTLSKLNAFALSRANDIKGVYITNPGQALLNWPGELRYDYTLNLANTPALAFWNMGDRVFTPSVELTGRECAEIGGNQELIVYGRIPLMHLRHCPLNAARSGGKHTVCRACDGAKDGKRLNDCTFTDRMNAVFPLRRTASGEGCVIDVLNSVPLCLAGHMDKLKYAGRYRLIFTDEDEQTVKRITGYFAGVIKDGRPDDGRITEKYTTGHYFRKTD